MLEVNGGTGKSACATGLLDRFLPQVGKGRLRRVEDETPFKLDLFERFAKLQNGGNYAAKHQKDAQNEKYRVHDSCRMEEPVEQGQL